jgi:uncharacterized repeat protein (TIGR01451 family)
MRKLIFVVSLLVLAFAIFSQPVLGVSTGTWHVKKIGNELRIHYGSGTNFPQYAVLHLDSGYFRLNYGPNSGWGTSIVLPPSFWSNGVYYQGTPVNASWRIESSKLIISITGTISSLDISSQVQLWPPIKNENIIAEIKTEIDGSVPLDTRPGEAFKPIMLSSMHISPTIWDTQTAYACLRVSSIPQSGWIFQPPAYVALFGLQGGASNWKINAPTVEVMLDRPMQVTGWVTPSNDPNDDNVALWAATDKVLTSWSYTVRTGPAPGPKNNCLSVEKQGSPSPVQDGALLTYTIRITNTAGAPLTAAITDTLPSQVTPPGILTWKSIINPGGTWTKQVVVTAQKGYTGALLNIVEVTTQEGLMDQTRVVICANVCLTNIPVILKRN